MTHAVQRRNIVVEGPVDAVLLVVLGWLLGILGGPLASYLARVRRARALTAALKSELKETRYTMCSMVWSLRSRLGTLDREVLEWMDPIERSYNGAGEIPERREMWDQLMALPAQEVAAAVAKRVRPNVGISLKEYRMSLLDARLADVSILPLDDQVTLSMARHHLDLFNQEVAFLRQQSNLTFDPAAYAANRESIDKNLADGYAKLADRARIAADAMSRFITDG